MTGGSIRDECIYYWRTSRQLALRKGDWKLVHNGSTPDEGKDELYNIPDDPFEERDLAKENPLKISELRKELARQFVMDKKP